MSTYLHIGYESVLYIMQYIVANDYICHVVGGSNSGLRDILDNARHSMLQVYINRTTEATTIYIASSLY